LFREFLNLQKGRGSRAVSGRSEDRPQPFHFHVLVPQLIPTTMSV
jgi:hypothetical protein